MAAATTTSAATAARVYDLVVIGGGSGGLQAAWDAATLHKAKVAVVDVQKVHGPPHFSALGGTCVNVGCVPKKLFVTGAAYREHFKDAKGFGWDVEALAVKHDWKAMVAAKDKAVRGINDSYDEMFRDTDGLDFYLGWASFQDRETVVVREAKDLTSRITETLVAKRTLIASGGWPFIPDIVGREHVITSNEAFYLPECPKRTLVVGGGYIAVEFAGIFQSFKPADGEVTLSYRGELFLRGFDIMPREELATQLAARGINLRFNTDPKKIELTDSGAKRVTFRDGSVAEYDCVMYATGRNPNTDSLNVAAAGVALAGDRSVQVDEFSRTNVPNIFAIGDVTNRIQLTPVAIHEASALVETVFAGKPRPVDHENVAHAVFSIPQVGACGVPEHVAAEKYSRIRIYKTRGTPLMHQLTGNEHKKYHMKIIVNHDDDRVVGVHLVFPEAAEVIQLVGVAMKCGVKMEHFHKTIGVHPTTSEDLCSMTTPEYYIINGEKHEKLPSNL